MRKFALRILANNEAGTWASWPEKIAAIKTFYAPVCELDITLTPTKLTPQFSQYPGVSNGAIYQVDEAWYEANVAPLADGANIVMFVVPPSDHTVPTLIGLEANHPKGPWQTSIFTNETDHTYQNEIDQGETAVVFATHELSHVFYAMLAKTDNTHLYFFAGTPEKVLAEFDFDEQELAWYQQAIQDLEQELGLLKARQIQPPVEPPANVVPTSIPSVSDLATFIKGYEGWFLPDMAGYPNGSISYQCNNPSNAKFEGQANAVARTFVINGVDEVFAAFDTYAHGWEYMIECLTAVVQGKSAVYNVPAQKLGFADCSELSLNQFFTIRDPKADSNTPLTYAAAAGKQFSVDPATFRMKQFTV
jgi:hypothetical protein